MPTKRQIEDAIHTLLRNAGDARTAVGELHGALERTPVPVAVRDEVPALVQLGSVYLACCARLIAAIQMPGSVKGGVMAPSKAQWVARFDGTSHMSPADLDTAPDPGQTEFLVEGLLPHDDRPVGIMLTAAEARVLRQAIDEFLFDVLPGGSDGPH